MITERSSNSRARLLLASGLAIAAVVALFALMDTISTSKLSLAASVPGLQLTNTLARTPGIKSQPAQGSAPGLRTRMGWMQRSTGLEAGRKQASRSGTVRATQMQTNEALEGISTQPNEDRSNDHTTNAHVESLASSDLVAGVGVFFGLLFMGLAFVWRTMSRRPSHHEERNPILAMATISVEKETDNKDSGEETPPTPGLNENAIFQCDKSVEFWRDFQSNGNLPAQENAQEVANIASRFADKGPDALSYFVRHTGRTGYFAANALLGTFGSSLHDRLVNNDDGASPLDSEIKLPFNIDSASASRLILEAFLSYEEDYLQIKDGNYREPWDMKSNHRQSSPINVLTQTGRFVNEAIGTLGRRNRMTEEDQNIWITDPASPSLYPEYYRTAFHYQTDGWMSKRSADVYETSTETLFLGRQDAMQRTSLPPIVQLAKNRDSSKQGPMKVLEVACGTGRFMTSIRDNLPLDTECTAVDLSPYYLDAARDNDAYWRKFRREEENRNGNDVGKDDIKPLRVIQAQAENLPFEDESFDAVVCVYLYHELPRDVRAKVSSEMSRVLKKDGVLVLTDSIQRGDRPVLDGRIGNFEKMNEPYYVDYCHDDLLGHFPSLKPMSKTVRSSSKALSFTK